MQPAPSPESESNVTAAAAKATAPTHLALGAAMCLSLLALSASCNKESPPAAEEPRAPVAAPEVAPNPEPAAAAPASPPVAAAPTPAPAGPAAASRVSEGPFEVSIASTGAVEAGKAAEAAIVLDAKEPFHVNDKYPYKFKLKPAEGLSYAADVVGKDRAKLEKMRVTLPVAFTPQKSGRHTVAGVFSFSVCTEDKCLIEKRELALDIDVK